MTTLTRLRPVVQATRLADGVHIRGWHSSFTMRGGDPLWRLWEQLEGRLLTGLPAAEFGALASTSAAVGLVERELRRHDMLVQVPSGWADGTAGRTPDPAIRSWLECVADDPATAWDRLSGTTFAILGAGPVAWAAHRALTDLQLTVTSDPEGSGAGGFVRLSADEIAVWAVCDDRTGAVLPPVSAGHDTGAPSPGALRLRDRLGVTALPPGATALQSLIGANAVHRLVCAVAGLPDPAIERGAPHPADHWQPPAVFVARLDPLRADYHPWLDQPPRTPPLPPASAPSIPATTAGPAPGVRTGTATAVAGALDAMAAGRRLDSLCDPELGPIERILSADLPQVPAALAVFRHGSTFYAGTAPTFEIARLVAGRSVAQATLDETGGGAFAGIDEVEASGRALRARWATQPPGSFVPESDWASHPAARRWLKVLTLNFDRAVTICVDRLAAGVHRARIDVGDDRAAVAVEATPGDAVAFAALTVAGVLQLDEAGFAIGRAVDGPCGATPIAGVENPAWPENAWTWPSDPRERERSFQDQLRAGPGGHGLHLTREDPARLSCFAATHAAVTVSS